MSRLLAGRSVSIREGKGRRRPANMLAANVPANNERRGFHGGRMRFCPLKVKPQQPPLSDKTPLSGPNGLKVLGFDYLLLSITPIAARY
jgi:hypothetical protein